MYKILGRNGPAEWRFLRIVLASLLLLLPNPFKPLRVPRSIVRTSDVKQVSGEEANLRSKSRLAIIKRLSWAPWRLSTLWSWSSQRWGRRRSRHRWEANFSFPPPPSWAKMDGCLCLVEVYLVRLKGRKVRRPWACLFPHPAASSCSSTFPSTFFPSPFFPLSDSLWDLSSVRSGE